ncbi:MAG TPA: aminoglycoside phosphotransferase [Actinopolymorphaceae bacterium]
MTSQRPDDGLTRDQLLQDYLSRQRWFAGKGRDFTVDEVFTVGRLPVPESAYRSETATGGTAAAAADLRIELRVELVRVRYSDATTETYQVPLEYRSAPAEHLAHAYVAQWEEPGFDGLALVYDALHDKEVTGAWLAELLARSSDSGMEFHRLGEPEVSPDEVSLVLTAEQSNTSLAFGEATLLKVFRRVHHGRNPDIEIHEALTRNNGRNIAKLHGWIDGAWPDLSGNVRRGDLGMFSEFFRTASDGWELAITSVRDLYAEGDLHPEEVGGDFAAESRRLGATTAEVHQDMARCLETGRWDSAEVTALAEVMQDRLVAAVAVVPELEPYVRGLQAAYDDLAKLSEPVPVQRIHGDFHLGQTMRTVGGWRIIDFEGEPAKSLEERIRLDSPLRDVAGMLRSFDYAAQHLLVEREVVVPDDEHQLVFRAREWADRNRAAFCEGYASVAGYDPRDHTVLLRAYETDKAVYEVVYESRTRPSWLSIPLGAVRRLAAAR